MAGFSVSTLAPFRGGRGALRLGLRILEESLWLDRGPARAERAAAKRHVFAKAPESLIVRPEAEAAIAELAGLIEADGATLGDAALAAFEDLLILLPVAGEYRLMAGALAFPTDWHLLRKIGLPLAAIHAPIPTYADKLSAGVDHVFATLTPERLLFRANWNVLETDALRYLPTVPAIERFDHVTAGNAGDTLFVRVERQTLRKMPETGAIVFTIGVYVAPLADLPPDLMADLSVAVRSVPEEEAQRRGTPAYRDALADYAYQHAGRC